MKEGNHQPDTFHVIPEQPFVELLDMGQWSADQEKGIFTCSGYVVDLLGLESNTLELESFYKMIREDYRARVTASISLASITQTSQLVFPIYKTNTVIWVSIRFRKDKQKETIHGVIFSVSPQDINMPELTSHGTVKNLLYQLNGIAKSLLTFMKNENLDEMVNHILAALVTHYSAERAYIFEYYWDKGTQSCTYEAVSRKGLEEIQNLQNMPLDGDTWWNRQVMAQRPIILNTLDDLPEGDAYDREVLDAQHIKSLMVIPFVNQDDTIWGYAGIDIVDKQRNWTEDDYQWFSSLMHIINICIELSKSKAQIQYDKEYLQNLYEHMPIGYLPIRLEYENGVPVDFTFTGANKEIERLLQMPASQIIGVKGSETFVAGDLRQLVEVANAKKHVEQDYQLPGSDVSCRIIKFSLRKDEVISLILDMTESHKIHQALEENEKLLRTIYNNLPVGFELYDKDGRLVQTNDKALEILGLDEPTPDNKLNIFEHPLIPANIKRKMQRGEVVDFALNYDFNKMIDFYELDKPQRPVQNLTVKIAPIFDDQQNIIFYLFLIINNTETTNAYLKIQEFEEYFSLIANLAKVGYFKWDLAANEGFGISQWFMNLGKPADMLISDSQADMYENLHPDDFRVISDFYDEVALGNAQSLEKEIRVVDPEGHTRWIRLTLTTRETPITHNIELVGVSYDITELKEMVLAKDKAEALDRLKSAFLANMSHEIRTPLNSIIGFTDLLAETEDEKERQEFVAIIQRSNELLLNLVTDILDLSKIESGTVNFIKKDLDAKVICNEVIQSFQNKKKPDKVSLELTNTVPENVIFHADPARVKQVLMNFITNAIKFTKEGTIRLGCELMEPENRILFYVQDTGIGIAEEDLGKVFDRFVKLNTFAQGTGLGLSICKSLIEEMGGTIGAESEKGKGSRFWITLPLFS